LKNFRLSGQGPPVPEYATGEQSVCLRRHLLLR